MGRRLAFISATGNLSGAEVVLLNLIGEALQRGLRVQCVSPEGALTSRLPVEVDHVVIPEQGLTSERKAIAAANWARNAQSAAKTIGAATADADALIVNGFLALPAVRLATPAAPVSWVVHDVLRRRDWFAVLRAVRPAITRAIPVSHAAAAPLLARGLPVSVVPNGVPWPVAPKTKEPVSPTIGCVAALTPWKGHQCLLEAFSQVRTPGARLELAGTPFPKDQVYAESLKRRARQPDLAARVAFLGRVDTTSQMRSWTIGVSPSIEPEAMPLVVLEALSVGLPMVATALGGSLEILGNAGGFLVPPDDSHSLAAALDALLSDRDERMRLAHAGRQIVAEHYRLDVQIRRQLDAVEGGPW